jgi:hypothetical protein
VRTQQFTLTLEKEGAATISENSIAVDPTSRLCSGTLPKGVGSVAEKWRRNGEKIRNDIMRWGLRHNSEKYIREAMKCLGRGFRRMLEEPPGLHDGARPLGVELFMLSTV